jgi:hypothetical protein
MTVSEIVAYLAETCDLVVTPQTVRNWQSRGRRGVKLIKGANKKAVSKFLSETGPTFGRGRPCLFCLDKPAAV